MIECICFLPISKEELHTSNLLKGTKAPSMEASALETIKTKLFLLGYAANPKRSVDTYHLPNTANIEEKSPAWKSAGHTEPLYKY